MCCAVWVGPPISRSTDGVHRGDGLRGRRVVRRVGGVLERMLFLRG
ncbi:hypothetical protein CCP1ISM_310007 [Azospirillaceae bacterium]